MSNKKPRVLVFEFHQESNTFNPKIEPIERFNPQMIFEGEECFKSRVDLLGVGSGSIKALWERGAEVIPSVFMHAASGGRVDDQVLSHLTERLEHHIKAAGELDGIVATLHGATCTESCDDACGVLMERIRALVGEKVVIAAAFDLHANITERMIKSVDIICGYNTYPHIDHFKTGHRASTLCMDLLEGKKHQMAIAEIPMLIPPAGYTDKEGAFKVLMDRAKEMVAQGKIADFTIFPVQPWLDIPEITSRVVTIGEDAEQAKQCADILAKGLFDLRDEAWPDLVDVDKIIDIAEENQSGKPVILADSADSPNGGCVGDSPVVAMRLQERGSKLRACMFVVDPVSVKKAFEIGVGKKGEFSIGAGYTAGMPGPFKGEGMVRSLHDGYFRTYKSGTGYLGLSAVVNFGNIDILLCEQGSNSGSPFIYRQFGMEPSFYDLVVVKANTSFRAPYSVISDLIYVADTPGAGASNLKLFQWKNLPKGLYPFDLPEGYQPDQAKFK